MKIKAYFIFSNRQEQMAEIQKILAKLVVEKAKTAQKGKDI